MIGGTAAIVVAAVLIAVFLSTGGSGKHTATDAAKQPAANYTTPSGVKVYGGIGPESVPLELGTPLASPNAGLTNTTIDGISCNAGEQLVYHHHIHLAIFVNGQPRPIPLGVGMVPPALVEQSASGPFAQGSNTCLYWLHVHATDGIVHIESPEVRTFELGQVFGIWHQAISSTQLGQYKGTVTATLNGQPWSGNPAQIPLDEHNQIVLNLGGPTVAPPPIDWSFTQL